MEKLWIKVNIFFALLGLIGGVAGFLIFVFGFYNFHAGAWSLISGLMATFMLHMHHMNLMDHLEVFYTQDRLKFTGFLGLFMSIISLVAAVCYIVIAKVNGIPVMPVETSLVLGAAQAFMTFKWSASLVYFSRKHYKAFTQARLLD